MIDSAFSQQKNGRPTLLTKWVGVAAMVLVMALGVLSVSSTLHQRIHRGAANHENGHEHHCVVTDFAAGEGWFSVPVVLLEPASNAIDTVKVAQERLRLAPVAFRLLPICGPPARDSV